MAENKMKTPGVIVLGVLAIIWGTLIWLTGLSNSDGRLLAPGESRPWFNIFLVSHNLLVNCKFYAITSLPFIAGIGVLMKKNWGRMLYIICAITGILWVLFNAFRDLKNNFGFLLIYAVIYFIPIWYFNRAQVKEQFKKTRS